MGILRPERNTTPFTRKREDSMSQNSATKSSFTAKLRPFVQGLFLLFFLYIFSQITFPLTDHLTKNFFFNLDPLIVLAMALAGTFFITTLLISLVTVVVTALAGRVFCGWFCPMGTVFDLFAKVIPARKPKKPFGRGKYKDIKYYLLVFLLVGTIAGFSALLFFDPLVFLMRVFALNVFPFLILTANFFLDLFRPLALKMGMMNLYMLSLEQPEFNAMAAAGLLLFAAVVALIHVERRFWCRNLCPLGSLLSLLSRYSIWGRRVSDACISCSKCARICPMNSIADDYRETSSRECIQCMRCEGVCPVQAISFATAGPNEQRYEFNPSRRGLIFSAFGGLFAGLMAGSASAVEKVHDKRLRPPGALVEKDFLDACLRCGECMKVCPTKGIQPAGLEAGVEGMFTPILVPRVGGCEERCNLCGQVCPTGAIRRLPLEEKQYATIGNAIIERNRCIAWEQLKVCLICDEVCPYDAIEFKMVTDEKGTLQRPFVIEDKCVGCGQCEMGCPVNGPAAIHVTPINEVRKNKGSYITEKVKQLREVDDEGVDFYDEYDVESGGAGGGGAQEQAMPWEQGGQSEGDLPPGFVE